MGIFQRRALAALACFVVLALVGATGYVVIEGVSYGDALYMTVITLTAVGYQEVFPLSGAGRSYTVAVLVMGISWMGAWFALVAAFLIELDLTQVLRSRRMTKQIDDLSGHMIVCGVGRTGTEVVRELENSGATWVVIEQRAARIARLRKELPDALMIEGDATRDAELEAAGIHRARGLVASLSQDTDNLFVCLSARDLNPELAIVARASQEETRDKLFRAGATHVVSPEISGGIRMASMLLRPTVVSFLEVATRSSDHALRVEQMRVNEGDAVAGTTLEEARIPQETGLIVIALRRGGEGGDFQFNPVPSTRIEAGDELVVLGEPRQVNRLREYIGGAT